MKSLIYFLLVACLFGCKKKHESLYGTLDVSGRIFDHVSNEPIAGAIVSLNPVRMRFDHPAYEGGPTDTTDALGNYSFSFNATGQFKFHIMANNDPWHMGSGNTKFQNDIITSFGTHVMDLKCHRTAFAKVNLENIAPLDTVSSVYFTGYNTIKLWDFYKDTTMYLVLSAQPGEEQRILYKTSADNAVSTLVVQVAAWDTIEITRRY